MTNVCSYSSTGDRQGQRKFGCLYLLPVIFFSLAYFAVYLPAAEKEASWLTPEGGCRVVSESASYECSCHTDQYGHRSCSSCRDYEVEFSPDGSDGQTVEVWLKEKGAYAYDVGTVYPKCKYDKDDFTSLDLEPISPTALPGFIVLVVLGAVFLLCPIVSCILCPGSFGFQKVGKPSEHRAKFPTGVVIFGPPGVGKRTVLEVARGRGFVTYDVTAMGNSYHTRLNAFNAAYSDLQRLGHGHDRGPALFVAADLRRHDIPRNCETVVLKPSFDVYDKRYHQCCERRPEENAHNHRAIYSGFRTSIFHRVLSGDLSPGQTLDLILEPFGYGNADAFQSTSLPAIAVAMSADDSKQFLLRTQV